MRWSRVLYTLLALLAAVAASAALLVPQIVQREVDLQIQQRLASVAHGSESLLALHARKWLDVTAHAATDGTLGEALEAASHGASNLDLLHKTAVERLAQWNGEWKAYQVIAVDVRGRVLARVALGGASEPALGDVWRDDLSTAAVVSEALRGYLLDDTWAMAGRLVRVAASPVVVRDRYAGALLVLLDLGAELSSQLHDMMGADLALVSAGHVLAGGGAAGFSDEATSFVAEHQVELRTKGRAEPHGAGRNGAVLASAVALSGEAGRSDAALVFLTARPRLDTLEALAARTDLRRLSVSPLGVVAGGLFFVMAVGFFALGREHDRPLRRLHASVLAASRGEWLPIDDTRFGGRMGTLVRAINGVVDRYVRASTERSALPDSSSLRTPPEVSFEDRREASSLPAGDPRIDAPARSPSGALPVSLPSVYDPPELDLGLLSDAPLGSGDFAAASTGGPDPGAGLPRNPSRSSRQSQPITQVSSELPAPRGSNETFRASPPPVVISPSAGLLALDPVGERSPAPRDVTLGGARDSFVAALGPDFRGDASPPSSSTRRELFDPPLLIPAATPVASDPLDAEFRAVWNDFTDTRQRCGESTEGVTFERFAGRLRANREQVMMRYACKSVRFHVYVKDGKAALKATPITE